MKSRLYEQGIAMMQSKGMVAERFDWQVKSLG
ncbi:hypothetical protein HNQ37_000842 [Lactovum miscens]|uniref:Uncharacterized protein n=1 Tax=Lactovum miscens TaxID=190387 RepID=A0A841C8P3_9LACT|nr:hypothetical protein [Lactovum miscens]